MNEKMNKFIAKYALWLSASYVVELAIRTLMNRVDLDFSRSQAGLFQLAIAGAVVLLNVIIALVIKKDKDAFQIPTQYVYLSTILYRPVGVCAFLLYALYNERQAKQITDEVGESL
jgi:hypothetical protein